MIAKKLKKFRERWNLSVNEASKLIGVAVPTWINWERGAFEPNARSRRKIEHLLSQTDEQMEAWLQIEGLVEGKNGSK